MTDAEMQHHLLCAAGHLITASRTIDEHYGDSAADDFMTCWNEHVYHLNKVRLHIRTQLKEAENANAGSH